MYSSSLNSFQPSSDSIARHHVRNHPHPDEEGQRGERGEEPESGETDLWMQYVYHHLSSETVS